MATNLFGAVLEDVLELARGGLTAPVSRAVVAPGGDPAWDECCEGMLWVRTLGLVPNGRPPTGVTQPCGPVQWELQLGIGVLRCAATLDNRGKAPGAAALLADALAITQDAADLSAALQCGLSAIEYVNGWGLTGWTPVGPDGGCVGGEWAVSVLVANCTTC